MGILFGIRPRLTDVETDNDLQNYGLSFVGNGAVKLEIFNDIQIPLQVIRRRINAEPPIDIQFILKDQA